jgi:mediator of RNA polymerase II transcription subunit 16
MSQHDSLGPHNPVEAKSALICLSKSGTLRLLYQQRDGRWLETTTEVGDSGAAVESSFTHASFAPDVGEFALRAYPGLEHSSDNHKESSLLLIAYQVSGSLRLFRIKVNWNLPVDQKDGQLGQQATSPPSLDVSALLEENNCCPTSIFAVDQDNPSNPALDNQNSYQLTYLELLPNAPEYGKDIAQGQASIMAIFTILPPRVMLDSSDPSGVMLNTSTSHQYQQATSIISRWQLRKGVQDKLPSCFEQLSVKKMSTTAITPRVCPIHSAPLVDH